MDERKEMNYMNFRQIVILSIVMCMVLVSGFVLGYFSKPLISMNNYFSDGSIPNNLTFGFDTSTLGYLSDRDNRTYVSSCNTYTEPYYSCPHNLQFINRTGLYCNGTIVCQN